MKMDTEQFKVTAAIDLKQMPTFVNLGISDSAKIKKLKKTRKKLSALQDVMYAHNKYSVLICLQGMDTSGKDSLIREVFKEFNPRGVVVHSFKMPTSNELEHDYLWRHYLALPERGKFAVFNRTHYENVLVSRVHPQILLNENLPNIRNIDEVTTEFWQERLQQIIHFENHIHTTGTIVFKFFLNLSKEEQCKRLLRRLDKPKHQWKFSPGDLKERDKWDNYQQYYQEAINATSSTNCPWFVIPVDHKETARLIIAKIVLQELEKYTQIQFPTLDAEIAENIQFYKAQLEKE